MSYTEFNHNVFRNPNIKWFDRIGIMPIDFDRRVEIMLDTGGCFNNYVLYRVKIIHKRNGTITVKTFRFDDYLSKSDRIDNRKDYNGSFHVWANNGNVDWYVARPSEQNIKRLTNAIMKYIEIYR